MSNFKGMKQNEKRVEIANTEAIEAIKDYLQGFASVSKLYKDLALAQTQVRQIVKHYGIDSQEFDEILDVFDQHYMLIELMEPFMEESEVQHGEE
jgi:abortive infection bacteriophage resistance protein